MSTDIFLSDISGSRGGQCAAYCTLAESDRRFGLSVALLHRLADGGSKHV
jgi:hypothetical protein